MLWLLLLVLRLLMLLLVIRCTTLIMHVQTKSTISDTIRAKWYCATAYCVIHMVIIQIVIEIKVKVLAGGVVGRIGRMLVVEVMIVVVVIAVMLVRLGWYVVQICCGRTSQVASTTQQVLIVCIATISALVRVKALYSASKQMRRLKMLMLSRWW